MKQNTLRSKYLLWIVEMTKIANSYMGPGTTLFFLLKSPGNGITKKKKLFARAAIRIMIGKV